MKGFTHQKVKEKRKWHKKWFNQPAELIQRKKRTVKKEPLRLISRILQNSPFAAAVIKFQIWNTFLTVPLEFQLKKQRKNTDG